VVEKKVHVHYLISWWVSCLPSLVLYETLEISDTSFDRPHVLPVTHQTQWNHWRNKALILTRENHQQALSFLQPPPDSWWKECYHLYVGLSDASTLQITGHNTRIEDTTCLVMLCNQNLLPAIWFPPKTWIWSECTHQLRYHHPPQLFYGLFSGTTQVSRCQKKASSGLYGAREDNKMQTYQQYWWAPLHSD